MQFTAVQYEVYCSTTCSLLQDNMKFTSVQHAVYCSTTWSLLQYNMQFTAVQHAVYCKTTNNRFHRGVFAGLLTLSDTSVVEKCFASSFKIEDYPVEESSVFLRNVDIRRLSLYSTSVQQTMNWINRRFIWKYKHTNK